MTTKEIKEHRRPMNVYVRRGSRAEKAFRKRAGSPIAESDCARNCTQSRPRFEVSGRENNSGLAIHEFLCRWRRMGSR